MSGFEIAGIVLGAYPILYDAAKDMRGVLKKSKFRRLFEREVVDFIAGAHKELIEFSQILEYLLDPLDPTPDQRRARQDEKRIQEKYHVRFMEQLVEMNTALDKLQA
ncbi:hypothetical protein GGR58DRAFT_525596 [Xylaria digitata]|nr:hypothetical protein GGR58DRAFT_525596 [Xylaria digitata]